ncbi:FUSC family protein [Streptomyces sp. NPDC001508]|uniref:FUSC family protein n=1 Tax=Streptomyces sp. NPDC001508 TaxID=3154656 RepID=UPI00332D4916
MRAGTRMALQMAVALAGAFVVERTLWPGHWTWTVLTAFLVCSGARSRGDVLVKGVWRTIGASAGTVVAGAVAGSFGPRSDAAVVVIFSVLAVAGWLRELSYAFWAGCVTAVLSLLYDWFGQDSGDLLGTRLAGVAVGAVLGLAASWLVLPIRTPAVVRAGRRRRWPGWANYWKPTGTTPGRSARHGAGSPTASIDWASPQRR